jgi:hypothetical protein
MRLDVCKSDAKGELRAFTAGIVGSKLPEGFRPWRAIGAVAPDAAPPRGLLRDSIEQAVDARGFQLWRLKAKAKAD